MIILPENTLKIDNFNEREKRTFEKFYNIKEAYELLFLYVSNTLANKNCYMDFKGLKDYHTYNKGSLIFIHELAINLAIDTYTNKNRRKNRNLATIILNELGGALGELTVAMTYKLKWEDFLEQISNRKSFTAFDLIINGKKVEVKTIHYRYLYKDENYIPIDTANNSYRHPKYWKQKEGKFDYTVLCYIWKGRFRIYGEVGWYAYETESFFFGSTLGIHKEYFEKRLKEDPSSKYKIVISLKYIYPEGTYSSQLKI